MIHRPWLCICAKEPDMANEWQRLIASGWTMGQTGRRTLETLEAAQQVIAARTPIINAALSSPLTGDYGELAKMVPEKVEAFSRAGAATLSAWATAQSAWINHMQYMRTVAMRGRPPTAAELVDLTQRMSAFSLQTIEASTNMAAAALAPIHGTVTANAQRLSRRKSRAQK